VIVGVNRFTEGSALKPPILKVDAAAESERCSRLAALRSRRGALAAASLEAVADAARSGANLMPSILAAVEAEATLGEIADRLRGVFGTHREASVF